MLIGMAGVGKSTIGPALAKALGFGFTDLDEHIKEKDGRTVQEVIDSEGEDALLGLEKRRMLEIKLDSRVVAPGGSLVYLPDLMEYLKRHSIIVYLYDSFENIEKRLGNAPGRGIVGLKIQSLRDVYEERRPLYSRYADITIGMANISPQQAVGEILRQYRGLGRNK